MRGCGHCSAAGGLGARVGLVACLVLVALAGFAGVAWAAGYTAYVVNASDSTVTPIATATNTPGTPIPVGGKPFAIAIAPDGETAYVGGDNEMTPINVATNTPETPIPVSGGVGVIAITPDGKTAYVTTGLNDVMPINLATNTLGTPIPVGTVSPGLGLNWIAITPDGKTAYVTNGHDDTVTPINLATNTPGTPIPVGAVPDHVAITPNGQTAYVANSGEFSVTPINLATNTPGPPIPVGAYPHGVTITPNGQTAYVTNAGDGTVTPIATATNRPGPAIPVGALAEAVAITPDGLTAYVTSYDDNVVTPIATATNSPDPAIPVGHGPYGIAITPFSQGARQTSTSVRCHPTSVLVDQSTVCTAAVTDIDSGAPVTPTGQVSFATDSVGSFGGSPCTLAGSGRTARCQVIYTPTGVGTGQHVLTATSNGDSAHVGSSGHTTVAVALDATRTRIRCRPRRVVVGGSTVCTSTVTDRVRRAPMPPSGLVRFASNKPGTFTGGPCTLSTTRRISSCQVSYTPAVGGAHELSASYSGDSANAGSRGRTILPVRCARGGPRSADRRSCSP
jgi:YVTN family beta-propeller protein